jgi:hypothetical protein
VGGVATESPLRRSIRKRRGPTRGNFLSRGDRDRTCDLWFWRPALCQLSYAPELRRNGTSASSGTIAAVQRHLLGLLFTAIAAALFLLAIYAARQGGAAWVVAIAAGALAAWMADLARRVLVRRRA